MQQYRLNYVLLIGLMVGSVLTSGVVYGVWNFQIKRRSVALVDEAEKAVAAKDYKRVVDDLAQYLAIQPNDNEQRIKYAEAYAQLAEQFDTSLEDRSRAVSVLEATLRDPDMANQKQLRKRLAKFYGGAGVYKDAISHLDLILDDPEAKVLKATYLYQSQNFDEALKYSYGLIGYNPEKDEFDPDSSKAAAPNNATVYFNVAMMLRDKKDRPELAEKVMDQAVKVNPNSAEAHLARGRYFVIAKEVERGKADVTKALQLSPDDAEVLYAAQDLSIQEKDYDKAREYIEKGKKTHSDDWRFYQAGAALDYTQKDYPKALKEIDEGLKAIPGPGGRNLLQTLAELQFNSQDLKGVRETARRMKEASYPGEALDWYEAKCLIGESKWMQANQLLNKLRPWAENRGASLAVDLYYYLAFSYEQLGAYELAKRFYDSVLERMPSNASAQAGRDRCVVRLSPDEMKTDSSPLQRLVDEELKKPKPQQDWSKVEKAVKQHADDNSLDETGRKLIWGRILVARQEFAAARTLAGELNRLSPKNIEVQTFALQSVRFDPAQGQGPQAALQLMEKLDLEDLPYWRLFKAELLVATKDDGTALQLAALLSGIDGWSDQQKTFLWSGMADRFLSLNMVDEARRCLTLAAQAQPSDLQTRMKLFGIALDTADDDAMKVAQDEILKVVGNNNDPSWLSTEARRHLSLIRRGREPIEKLDDVRQLVTRALDGRPEWHELHLINAEIELLAGHRKLALEDLERAHKFGRLAPVAIAQQIRLLAQDGQFASAAAMLDELPEPTRFPLLNELYWELLFRTDKVEDAIKSARSQAESNPNNAQMQFRYGQMLARAADQPGVSDDKKKAMLDQSVQAVEKAVKLQPDFPDAWYSLIVFNAMAKNQEGALKSLRNAQLSLSGDSLQLILAKSFEALNGWFDAEAIYRSMYEADPTDMDRVQQFAAFYVGPGYKGPNMREKATPLVNQILRAGAEGKIPPNDEHLLWARRTGAKLLAATRDYQQLRKAENLLASNSQDGTLSLDDRLEMAQILASRPEPESLVKAAGLLEEIDKAQQLGEMPTLVLANIYYRLGQWDNCQRLLRLAMDRYKKSVPVRQSYAEMLLNRGKDADLKTAERPISDLRTLAPLDPTTFRLTAKYAIKTGKSDVIHQELIRRLAKYTDPKTDPKSISDAEAQMLDLYATLLIELKDLDRAEQIYRVMAKRNPTAIFVVASFLGMHRDVDQCFAELDPQFNATNVQNVLRVAVDVVRKRRDEVRDRYDARIDAWLDRALQNNIGSVPLLMAKAEFREVQKKYDDAAGIYHDLLANPDVTGVARAVVLNNLSFLLALAGQNTSAAGVDPLDLVEEAAQILGPSADILDTRAVVWIARKKYDAAIADLSLSLTDNPTASKYFHKAQAHLGAGENRVIGQNKAALEAWAKAEELGLSRDSLNQLEQERYDQVKAQIDKLRAGNTSVTQAPPAAK